MIVRNVAHSALGFSQSRLETVAGALESTLQKLQEELPFDSIVVMGTSGLSIAMAMITLGTRFNFVLARKKGEKSHSDQVVAIGSKDVVLERYIILDDLVASGATVRAAIREIDTYAGYYGEPSECVGAVMYMQKWVEAPSILVKVDLQLDGPTFSLV